MVKRVQKRNRNGKGDYRATKDANNRKRQTTDGESRFLRSGMYRPIPINDRAVEVKLACKNHGKQEGLYEVLAPGSNILKVSPTPSTIKQPSKIVLTATKSQIAKIGTLLERQTPLKACADHQGPRNSEKLLEERIQSLNQGTHEENQGRQKDETSKTSARQRSFIFPFQYCTSDARANSEFTKFFALRNRLDISQSDWQSELIIPAPTAFTSALQQVQPAASTAPENKRSSAKN